MLVSQCLKRNNRNIVASSTHHEVTRRTTIGNTTTIVLRSRPPAPIRAFVSPAPHSSSSSLSTTGSCKVLHPVVMSTTTLPRFTKYGHNTLAPLCDAVRLRKGNLVYGEHVRNPKTHIEPILTASKLYTHPRSHPPPLLLRGIRFNQRHVTGTHGGVKIYWMTRRFA